MMRADRTLAILAGLLLAATGPGAPDRGTAAPNPVAARSVDDPGAQCREAADLAAVRHGVPAGVLHAIALAESGMRRGGVFQPWPWTLNVEGQGFRFDDARAALAHARSAMRAGARSVDLGCFQINHRWHGSAFASLEAMLDPGVSADYAARFLRQLFAESGDWLTAVGHYHSRTAVHADRYRAQVEALLARTGDVVPHAAPAAQDRLPTPASRMRPSVGGVLLAGSLGIPPGHRGGPQQLVRHAPDAASLRPSASPGTAALASGSLFSPAAWAMSANVPAAPRVPLIGRARGPLLAGGS